MIESNVDIAAYHSDLAAGISKSGLDMIAKSPMHYYAAYLDPNRPARTPPTTAMQLGTMTHTLVLEPQEFARRYSVMPTLDRRTKAGKEDYAAFVAGLLPRQEAADQEMVSQAQAMAASVRKIKPIADLLAEGEAEVTARWTDEETGLLCKCRPDFTSPAGDGVVIMDLKTCIDASASGFARSVVNYNYAMQAAWYTDGYEKASGKRVHGFVFAAVEKTYPFAAAAYMLDEEAIERAQRKYRRLLDLYATCMESGIWPGYTSDNEIQILQLPAWANKETE